MTSLHSIISRQERRKKKSLYQLCTLQNMASPQTLWPEKEHFFRSVDIIVELLPIPLRLILHNKIKPDKIWIRASNCNDIHLSDPQKEILKEAKDIGNYSKCDTTLIYALLRYLTNVEKPTEDWGPQPKSDSMQKIGDEIERIRHIRNEVFAHVWTATMTDQQYKKFLQDVRDIFERMEKKSYLKGNNHYSNITWFFFPYLVNRHEAERCWDIQYKHYHATTAEER